MNPRTRIPGSKSAPCFSRHHGILSISAFPLLAATFLTFAVVLLAAGAPGLAQQAQPNGDQQNAPSQYPQQAPPQYQQQAPPPQYQQQAPPQYQQPDNGQQEGYPSPAPGENPGQPYAPQGGQRYAGQQAPLTPDQLEQLVAPIALYPDSLLAQILTASTYPEQVAAADQWLQQMQAQGQVPPDQVAAGADSQNWDPSVKGLTAFPQVLEMMDQNLEWTTQLGDAYFNQPQDVMQTVQVLRQRAEQAGTLQNTPQESVSQDQGAIELAPPSPDYAYVPAYNPWSSYGEPISPYPGFSLTGALGSLLGNGSGGGPMRFGAGIAMAAFDHTPFGMLGWSLSWLRSAVSFHNAPYFTNSETVADWGYPHGGPRAYADWHRGGHQARHYRPAFGHAPIPYNRAGRFDRGDYARPAPPSRSGQEGSRPATRPPDHGFSNGFRTAPPPNPDPGKSAPGFTAVGNPALAHGGHKAKGFAEAAPKGVYKGGKSVAKGFAHIGRHHQKAPSIKVHHEKAPRVKIHHEKTRHIKSHHEKAPKEKHSREDKHH
jgi:hypothetical protein